MKLRIVRTPQPLKLRVVRSAPRYFSLHTHSRYSANDAMPSVQAIVDRAKELGYRGLGLTDHGNMAGTVQLYQACKKAGIKPFPGTEIYLVRDRSDPKAKRYHAGVLAYTNVGYRNLVALNTKMAEQFHNKPIVDLADLAQMYADGETEGLAFLTGCYFSLTVQTLVTEGYDAAKRVVAMFASWFPQSTYVELQNHMIDQGEDWTDHTISLALAQIATELRLPVVCTQDSHYVHPEERVHHDALKRLVSFGPEIDDGTFPGDGYHMVDDAWMKQHHPETYERCMAGLDELLAEHTLTIPELDEYAYQVPFTVAEPLEALRERCTARLQELGIDDQTHYLRMDHELDIITITGMAGYLMLVAEVTDHCRDEHIFFQARGSASGSLLCFLLQITPVDPIKWGLLMERFLSKDRTKPPDIDLDIESTRRKELMDWLATRYSVLQIGNWMTYSMSGEEDGKGSLRVRYFTLQHRLGKEPSWETVDPQIRTQLNELGEMKLISGYGVHASGLLLTTTHSEMAALVPQMYVASSKTFVSQYDMADVEKLGLVKLDVLGLKTMAVLRQTITNLKRDPAEGLEFIPMSDLPTFRMLAKADTAGVFQLEGNTAARGMRELRPSSIRDVIASMALYRPATMKSGATEAYVLRKHKQQSVPERHPVIMRHTKNTYGLLLYQEQVISVLRDLGMDADDLTAFLKAVKASNDKVEEAKATISRMMAQVDELCARAGMDEVDVAWLHQAFAAYAEYGFNQAHATVYGLTAWRCAWLAVNTPVEFHSALLAVAAGTDKEKEYIRAARQRGVRVLAPDVNFSGVRYAMDPKGRGIRKGLLSIDRVGEKAAAAIVEGQPFADLADFKARVNPRPVTGVKAMPVDREAFLLAEKNGDLIGVVAKLAAAGAFRSIVEED